MFCVTFRFSLAYVMIALEITIIVYYALIFCLSLLKAVQFIHIAKDYGSPEMTAINDTESVQIRYPSGGNLTLKLFKND